MSNLSNDHWFERNCDPSDVEQQEQPVQSGVEELVRLVVPPP
ncbi:MAG: hypothetical protein CM15mV17_1110 [Caudoviricetes sp.]|nr:MAG: hypothetical protein CM15mV17_1110 [Caudoviricetes sp.]